MNQFDLYKFWRKYGNLILGGLFFLFIISYCNRQPVTDQQTSSKQEEAVSESKPENERYLKNYEELVRDRYSNEESQGPNSFFLMLLLLMLGVGVVWLARQPWLQVWWRRLFPGRVKFKVTKGRDKMTGRDLLKISIYNNTAEGLTFLSPNVVFSRWGQERRFRLRSSDQEDMFPLTLTAGTGHRVVLDLEQFYEKLPELKQFNRVGATVETTDGKKYKKFALPPWLELLIG